MTDLEMTMLCADALGLSIREFDPLDDDGQAMALVKKFELFLIRATRDGKETWNVWAHPLPVGESPCGDDLNRVIVECVALIQKHATAAVGQSSSTKEK